MFGGYIGYSDEPGGAASGCEGEEFRRGISVYVKEEEGMEGFWEGRVRY